MEHLDLDPLTWEHDLPTMADASTRVEYAIAEASYAIRAINQNAANAAIAIHTVLEEARDYPSVFVGRHADPTDREHVDFAIRAAVSDLAVQLSLSEDTILNYDRQAVVMRSRTPKTWAAFRHGEITPQNAKVVTALAESLPDEPEMWAQFMKMQSPLMQGMVGTYAGQSTDTFVQMQEQIQKQTEQMLGAFGLKR